MIKNKEHFKIRIEMNEEGFATEIIGDERYITAGLMMVIETIAEMKNIGTIDYVSELLGAAIFEENSKPF